MASKAVLSSAKPTTITFSGVNAMSAMRLPSSIA
jgi:hypothetical protein